MKVEEYRERKLELAGWPVNVSSYRLGEQWHAKADNVSPGAALSRATAETRDAAENKVLTRAGELLGRTHRRDVS
jgi:hypothetical protein